MSLQPVSRWDSGLTAADAEKVASRSFGVEGEAHPLPGERDDNFRIRCDAGDYVLKVAHPDDPRLTIEGQNRAMGILGDVSSTFRVPRVIESLDGQRVVTATLRGSTRLVRLLEFVPGIPLVEITHRDAELLTSIGRMLGSMDDVFAGFHHPGARRELYWDLRHAGTVVQRQFASVSTSQGRALVQHFLERFQCSVEPALPRLRTSVIHSDANDHNILVTLPSRGSQVGIGIIDFGDLVESHTVCEVAIACAYVMLGQDDPLRAAAHVCRGYHEAYPLLDDEYDVLFDLICMRLCVSVTVAASRSVETNANSYLAVSERPAWDLLRHLVDIQPSQAGQLLRSAPS